MQKFNKIFGIGLNKTGTTSLQAALEILGFRTYHFARQLMGIIEEERKKAMSSIVRNFVIIDT